MWSFHSSRSQDADKIFQYNYEATKIAIERAFSKKPTMDEIIKKKNETGILFTISLFIFLNTFFKKG
jgi:formaldehyde-activating enzyme